MIGCLVAVPELQNEGVARLEERRQGFMKIRFLATGAEMTQEERRVVRYGLLPGTRVTVPLQDEQVMHARIDEQAPQRENSGRLIYHARDEHDIAITIDERDISSVHIDADPLAQLRDVAFHDLRRRFAKAGTPEEGEAFSSLMWSARHRLSAFRDAAWEVCGGVPALAGARVKPLPHQLNTARRILADRQVRYLLADEVGLGKTIEAGLVMQSLAAMNPHLRVLVVVPGALVSQWFLELYSKFGGRRFLMLDAERLAETGSQVWKEERSLIVSSRALEELSGKHAVAFQSAPWDLLIVDECHRMDPYGVLYRRLAALSKRIPHVLLLSATPTRQHPRDYLALLALLQPDVYRLEDEAAFAQRFAAQDAVLALCRRTEQADEADEALVEEWQALLQDDRAGHELLDAWRQAQSAKALLAARLVAYAHEHYRLDGRIIQHRRGALARLAESTGVRGLGLALRCGERIVYARNPREAAVADALARYRQALVDRFAEKDVVPVRLAHWLLQCEMALWSHPVVLERLLAMRAAVLAAPEDYEEYALRAAATTELAQVLRGDLSEAERLAHVACSAACHIDVAHETPLLKDLRVAVEAWGKSKRPKRIDALLDRLRRFWEEHPDEKVLVFAANSLAVAPVAELLADELGGERVATFGGHLDLIGREEEARRFASDDRCAVLVSDPLGGEGRNFQFASVVAHLDLPWSIAAVEQRIGRVDRIGRDGEVPSWVFAADAADAVDAAWADLLEVHVGVFDQSASGLEFITDRVETAALEAALRGGAAGLHEVAADLGAVVSEERAARQTQEDEQVGADENAFRQAARLAEEVATFTAPVDAVLRWLRGMGGQVKRDDEGLRAWHVRPPGADNWLDGVFYRDQALAREDLAFLSLGNELVDRIISDADAAEWCGATAWRRRPRGAVGRWEGLRIEALWIGDLLPLAEAGLPLTVLRRLYARWSAPRWSAWFRFPDGERETDPEILEVLQPHFDPREGDSALSVRSSRELWTNGLVGGKLDQILEWQRHIDAGADAARQWADSLAAEAAESGRAALDEELDRAAAVVAAQLANAKRRWDTAHPDVQRLQAEADAEAQQAAALRAAIDGGRAVIVGAAYCIVA